MRGGQKNCQAQKIRACPLARNTPELAGLITLLLELEANSQLNLALAEKGAVSAGYAVEPAGATAEVQEWLGRGC